MTDRVVVGIDFSKASITAAEWAAREMAPNVELVLVHVMALPTVPAILRSRLPKHALTADTLRIGADMQMRALCRSLEPRRVWPEFLEGDPASALVQVATSFDARMIVVGAHTEGAGLGGTASRLLAESHVPIVVLGKEPPAQPFHLLAPVDQRASAELAVSESRSLFGGTTRNLTLLHVIPGNVMKHFVEQGNWEDADYASEFQWVDRWSRLAREAGWPAAQVRSEEALGNPVRAIRAAVERLAVDFVVMPRRNGGNLRRVILGSVTEAIVKDPPCSVIILPERRAVHEPAARAVPARMADLFPAMVP